MLELLPVYCEPQAYVLLETVLGQETNSTLDKFTEVYTTMSGITTISGVQLEQDLEDRMRILANRLIDLILEDKEKGALRFIS
ncbi:MAG: hypothetical protein ACOZBZ_04400 [Patescibacteria group bacterium]